MTPENSSEPTVLWSSRGVFVEPQKHTLMKGVVVKKTKTKKTKAKKVFCTICPKWEIKRPEVCSNTLTAKGKKHYFCTKRCKERFTKNQERVA